MHLVKDNFLIRDGIKPLSFTTISVNLSTLDDASFSSSVRHTDTVDEIFWFILGNMIETKYMFDHEILNEASLGEID